MNRKFIFNIIAFFLSLILLFIGGEIITRLFYKAPPTGYDERNVLYQYDAALGWFPIKNKQRKYKGSHVIQVKQNSLGFRDIEHGEKTKKRMAFIGDSFVWGYDVEQDEVFTNKLRPKLPDWDIINMGVSGYGTDQAYLMLQNWFDHFQPDVVGLVFFSENDFEDNASNERYGYYKPYFTIENDQLKLNGSPVPVSRRYFKKKYPNLHKSKFIEFLFEMSLQKKVVNEGDEVSIRLMKALNEYVKGKGATFFIAFAVGADQGQHCSFCEAAGINHVFVTNDFRYPKLGNHWTPEGHDFVAEKIYQFLLEQGITGK